MFGEPGYEYRDDQAVADGVLITLVANRKDTGHWMTSNAFETLKDHYRERGYATYTDAEFYRQILLCGDDAAGAFRQA